MTYYVQYLTNYGWESVTRHNNLDEAIADAGYSSVVNQLIYRVIEEGGNVLYHCTPDGYSPEDPDGCSLEHCLGGKLRWQEVGF